MANKRKEFMCDFETTTEAWYVKKGYVEVYLAYAEDLHSTESFTGLSLTQFMNFCFSQKSETVFYFHNLSFDGKFIMHWLCESGFIFKEVQEEEWKANGVPSFKAIWDERDNLYMLQVWNGRVEVIFKCTAKLIPMTVKKMGQVLSKETGQSMDKLVIDYDALGPVKDINDFPAGVVEYCIRDVQIVKEFVNRFREVYPKVTGITTSSMSEAIVKKMYGQSEWVHDFGGTLYIKGKKQKTEEVLTREQWDNINRSYFGGFTTINPKYKEVEVNCENGQVYDVNSLYPHIMANVKLPYGRPLNHKPRGDYVKLLHIMVDSFKLKEGMIPHFHNWFEEDNERDSYYSEYHGDGILVSYWENEWEEILKDYNVSYTIVEEVYFQAKYSLREVIYELYKNKANAKNEIEKTAHKLVLNSIYGKTAQNPDRVSKILTLDGLDNEIIRESVLLFGGKYRVDVELTSSEELRYIPMGSYITASARTLLLQAIRENIDNFLYADTDSIFLKGDPKGIYIHDSDLGAWKLDGTFTRFKALKPKCYICYDKNKDKWKTGIAGLIKEKHSLLNFENFQVGTVLEGANKGKKNVKGGIIIVQKPFSL